MDSLKYDAALDYVRRQIGATSRPLAPDASRAPAVSSLASSMASGLAQRSAWAWLSLALCAATMPFWGGLTGSRVFYIRDLTMVSWGRYLWLRQELLSGSFPLWNSYVGGGQSAVADPLHQLFLVPALAVRLIGGEGTGFNLWVATPFPLAALGAWLFFRRRFAADASALGAIAFSLSGPIVSTGNFPNLSWAAAAIPWVLWAVDRVAATAAPGHIAALAVVVSLQAFAGEPVTLVATLVVGVAFAAVVSGSSSAPLPRRALLTAAASLGVALGLGVAAVQLVPLGSAAAVSERAATVPGDFWSMHPLGLVEMVSLHLFGDFFASQSPEATPWLRILNSGREPFLFSIYIGVPVLGVVLFGAIARGASRWTLFWIAAGATSLLSAFGAHTPVYPFVRDHLPLLPYFRFPATYLAMWSMVVAAATASGWDSMVYGGRGRRFTNARIAAVVLPLTLGALGWLAAGACMILPNASALQFYELAQSLGVADPVGAAAYMLRTLPRAASSVLLLSAATALLVFAGTRIHKRSSLARTALFVLIVADLVGHAWGVNPTIDRRYLGEPDWLRLTHGQPDSRFYVGGKTGGTLDPSDLDASGAYLNPPGLTGSMSRAALSSQANFDPSGWRSREMLSYDLAILWPLDFTLTSRRFFRSGRFERDLFLDRTGVRYRVLPQREAAGRAPMVQVPYLLESFLYDYGTTVAPRAMVISQAKVAGDLERQIETLFTAGWDSRSTVTIEREPAAAGDSRPPVPPSASITTDTANHVVVDAGIGRDGGYVVLLDSYSGDWHATADGRPAAIVRANGLFRAVRLHPGPHVVEFFYRPRALMIGATISAVALALTIGLIAWPLRSRRSDRVGSGAGPGRRTRQDAKATSFSDGPHSVS
jgi:hypothetical protein